LISGSDATDGDATYTVTPDDRGKRLRAVETAENAEGRTPTTSNAVLIGLPRVITAPSITGSKQTGKTLTATHGDWTETPGSYGYQWLRCADTSVGSCSPIASATSSTYVLTDDDDAQRIRVRTTATNDVGTSGASTSRATGLIDIPTNTARPAFTGGTTTGSELSTDHGEWTGTLTGHQVAWVRCTGVAFATCTPIEGATADSYTLTAEDEGFRIRSRVRATSPSGTSAPAYSYAFIAQPAT
jgi:hypothetical protein